MLVIVYLVFFSYILPAFLHRREKCTFHARKSLQKHEKAKDSFTFLPLIAGGITLAQEVLFYNVFRNTIRILLNKYENIKLREIVEKLTKDMFIFLKHVVKHS